MPNRSRSYIPTCLDPAVLAQQRRGAPATTTDIIVRQPQIGGKSGCSSPAGPVLLLNQSGRFVRCPNGPHETQHPRGVCARCIHPPYEYTLSSGIAANSEQPGATEMSIHSTGMGD